MQKGEIQLIILKFVGRIIAVIFASILALFAWASLGTVLYDMLKSNDRLIKRLGYILLVAFFSISLIMLLKFIF